MCSPKPPKQNVVAPLPPLDAPKPMASPESGGPALNLSQLRIGTKNNLRMRTSAGGLGIPKAP